MRKKIVIAVATIVVGAGAAGAVVAFRSAPEDGMDAKSCAEMLKDPPKGGWTCYGPPPEGYSGEYGWTGDPATSKLVNK